MGTLRELIDRHQSEILSAWTEAAQQAVSARDLSSLELASLMPRYLSLLGERTPEPDGRLGDAQIALIEDHLANRLREGFDLSEILTEFAVLGRCITALLAAVADDERPPFADVARLYAELFQTSTVVTRIFNEHLLEDEQSMKRYARLLGAIALEPGVAGDRAGLPGTRLAEMVELIFDALAARAVAVLLLDATGERATASAAVGEGAAELELHARSTERTAVAREVTVAEDTSRIVRPPPALVEDGIGSLLRVGYRGRSSLCCVLYVAHAADRPFTASEARRAQGLCRELAVHLDNARLHASLTEMVDELRSEREHRERVVSILVRLIRGPLAAARSNARQLLRDAPDLGAVAVQMIEGLCRLETVVDDLLATTPVVRSDVGR
jgi:hypothetical protein